MKRITMLVLAFALVLGGALAAYAEHVTGSGGAGLEFNAKGSWRMSLEHIDNAIDFDDDDDTASEQDFNAYIRARTWFEFIASENLKAVLGTEIGDVTFGNGGGRLGADAVAIEVKHAYLQFKLPNTPVTAIGGIQPIYIPGNYGSLLFDDDASALMFSVPFNDMVSLAFGWVRYNNLETTGIGAWNGTAYPDVDGEADDIDVFPFILNIKTDMVGAQPYFVYANIGEDAIAGNTGSAYSYWLGLSTQIKPMDQLAILFDAIYGAQNADDDENDAKGYGAVLAVDFILPMVTPEFFALYFSGEDDDDDDGSERMPVVSPDFTATSFGFDGSAVGASPYVGTSPASIGLWALGLKAKKLTFVPGLTHDIVLMYAQGTNDEDSGALFTEEDSLIEFNFDTQYKIYDQLTGYVELGYLKWDMDDDVHGDDFMDDGAIKAVLGLKYSF